MFNNCRNRRSKWKEREEELRAIAGTMRAEDIAKRYGVSARCLSWACSVLGISLKLTPEAKLSNPYRHAGGPKKGSKKASLHHKANALWRPTSFAVIETGNIK